MATLDVKEDKIQEIVIGDIDPIRLHVTSCQVSSRSRLIKHPLESGVSVIDDKVQDPRTISIQAVVSASDGATKKALREMWRNRAFKFPTVKTRETTYKNFCCTECSHTESTERLNMLEYTIRFEEIMEAMKRAQAPNPDDANVVDNS